MEPGAAVPMDVASSLGAVPGERVPGFELVVQLATRIRNTLTRTMLIRLAMEVKRSGLGQSHVRIFKVSPARDHISAEDHGQGGEQRHVIIP